MWKFPEDSTVPIITAKQHIASSHGSMEIRLPETAVLFYMHSGEGFVRSNYRTKLLSERFPRFLNACPIYQLEEYDRLCFLDGGRGAPQAADTLETLVALGVKNIVSVGMFGAFEENINSGDIIIPNKAFVEEGTSLHYYSEIEYSVPDYDLHSKAMNIISGAGSFPIISTDSVYRQTFYKERLWREQGAVGVDMETSALFSVGAYLNVKVVSILMASDKHPMDENGHSWQWRMTDKMRYDFFEKCLELAVNI